MTREEAIEILEDMIDYQWGFADYEKPIAIRALHMAIEALSKDAIPISWLEEKLTGHPEIPYSVTDGINDVLDLWRGEKHE